MIRRCFAAVAIAALLVATTGCLGSVELQSYSKARTPDALERIDAGYGRIRQPAAAAIDRLPESKARRARLALRLADAALAMTRHGATLTDRLRALRDLTIQAAILASLTPNSD